MKAIVALLPLLFSSCMPDLLVPYDFAIEKNNTEAYIEVDSVTVSLKNLEIKGDHYVFGMEVQNNSSKPVFINTDKVLKFAHHLSYGPGENKKHLQEVVPAMSLTQVNQFFEAKNKDAQAAAFFLFLIGAAITTYDALKDEEDHSKESWTKRDEKKSRTRDIITTTSLLATDILTEAALMESEKARAELQYLPNELFDRSVIYPGESYFGKVLFRKVDEVQNYHRIVCPIENKDLLFDFRKATPKEKKFLHEQRR